jgi:hypothetical protein
MAYREDRGWGFGDGKPVQNHVIRLEQQVIELQARIERLEAQSPVAPHSDSGGI